MSNERDIGRLETTAGYHDKRLARIEQKLDVTLEYIIASKTTRRNLATLSTIAGAVGASVMAVVTAMLNHFKA